MLPQYHNNVSEIINKVPLTFLLANNFSNNSSNDRSTKQWARFTVTGPCIS